MIKRITVFFDKLEDKVRSFLSGWPIFYAILASLGTVLLWRGIWHTADHLQIGDLLSIGLGILILLITGVFVSAFIGNRLLLTGMRKEKKLTEKTKKEIENDLNSETEILESINDSLKHLERSVNSIKKKK